jgi:hypothetical protein
VAQARGDPGVQGDTGGYGGLHTGGYGGIRGDRPPALEAHDPTTPEAETLHQATCRALLLEQLAQVATHQGQARQAHWTGPDHEAELEAWRSLEHLCQAYRDALGLGPPPRRMA